MSLDDLEIGLCQSASLTVSDRLTVPAQAAVFSPGAEMPPVFATAQMIAFVEWTCVAALAPYLAPHQRTVGTGVEMTHIAATPTGMTVPAEVELVAFDGRVLRFKIACRDERELIGDGFHERTIVDHDRFMARLARKQDG